MPQTHQKPNRHHTTQLALGEFKRYFQSISSDLAPAQPSQSAQNGQPKQTDKSYQTDQKIIIGVSGGADSLALLHIASIYFDKKNIIAVIVDHGIQPTTTAVATDTVDQIYSKYNIKAIVKTAQISGSDNLEAKARAERYRLLKSECAPGDILLLGHTKDDQVESVLLGLMRSSGLPATSGMQRHILADDIHICRPFLQNVTRKMTESICVNAELKYWDDPTNFIDDTKSVQNAPLRTQVRRIALPVLEKIAPGVSANLARTAELSQIDADYLDDQALKATAECVLNSNKICHPDAPHCTPDPPCHPELDSGSSSHTFIDLQKLKQYHKALRTRIIRSWIHSQIRDENPDNTALLPQIPYERIDEIDNKLVQNNGIGGTKIEVFRGITVKRRHKSLYLELS